MTRPTLYEIERALDKVQSTPRHIEVYVGKGKWWKVRRNGKTKEWATRPGHFRIPIKAGINSYGTIAHDSDWGWSDTGYRLVEPGVVK